MVSNRISKNDGGHGDALRVVPRRHVTRDVVSVVCVLLLAAVVWSAATNERFGWPVVAHYFLSPLVLVGLWNTILVTVLSMLLAFVLGVVVELMNESGAPVLKFISSIYLWVFRGTPLLVQVIILFNISALYPKIGFGIPFTDIGTGPIDVNSVITPFAVGVLALGINEGAYMAEVIRGGILAVPAGQIDAAKSIGMKPMQVFFKIVFPQAIRSIIPATGNQVISMMKASSLVSVIAFPDLLYSVQAIYARNFQTIPLLIVASIWYLIVTTVLMAVQRVVERHYTRKGTER
ncbi:amino acid ABC transporter permease [Bifidobacterium parmae]|uniref:ABC transporter permease n=1 Tax=Bifidobacterium parmae TaxID=361854 RepID=A0A2N5J3F5_9BIFI|nr:amino acid ABC transporter permease [Bifidobacterium parmae]PLS28726.1 ABC transporter permease [Bifidobacterium parmae]